MKKIFISSVQKEFAKERKQLAKYIRNDIILRHFFNVFLFEEVPAQERTPSEVYLNEVHDCDIYLGLLGSTYGNVNTQGISATEQEYDEAGKQNKERICFVLNRRQIFDIRQDAFIKKVSADTVRKKFSDYKELQNLVYAALANYLSTRDYISTKPFDESTNADIELSDLSKNKIRSFVKTAKGKRDFKVTKNATSERILTSLGLINDIGRILNPAALIFGKNPQKHFITSEVKCVQFFANQVSKPLADYQIYKGDVFELVDQATYFVMSHIRNWVGTRDSGDTAAVPTKFELPYDAVKEAIVNAVCHRDYTSKASVQVMLFSDRLEVMSPGALPRGMTITKLAKPHKSIPVNPHLANAMYLAGYVERAGTGTEDIINKCKEWGLLAPV
jgi:predicted HTH transcriptional regulator